jgi:hypothetical protein
MTLARSFSHNPPHLLAVAVVGVVVVVEELVGAAWTLIKQAHKIAHLAHAFSPCLY